MGCGRGTQIGSSSLSHSHSTIHNPLVILQIWQRSSIDQATHRATEQPHMLTDRTNNAPWTFAYTTYPRCWSQLHCGSHTAEDNAVQSHTPRHSSISPRPLTMALLFARLPIRLHSPNTDEAAVHPAMAALTFPSGSTSAASSTARLQYPRSYIRRPPQSPQQSRYSLGRLSKTETARLHRTTILSSILPRCRSPYTKTSAVRATFKVAEPTSILPDIKASTTTAAASPSDFALRASTGASLLISTRTTSVLTSSSRPPPSSYSTANATTNDVAPADP